METNFLDTQLFCERTLPMLTHFQLCEGLKVVAGQFLPQLEAWEKAKFNAHLSYEQNSRGIECTISKFRKRLNQFGQKVFELDQGMVPFEFNPTTGDYWPDMDISNEVDLGLGKQMYAQNRILENKKFFEELHRKEALVR